jgi:hypothetical protein
MLKRAAVISTMTVMLLWSPPAPPATAHAILPQQCTSNIGKSTKAATLSFWKKKCKPPKPSGGNSSLDSKPKTRKCLLMEVPSADGTCPVPGPGNLPHLPHQFGSLVPVEESVVAALGLPEATPRFGPDPSVNEWKMLAVGFPIWLWTDGPRQLRTHVRRGGLDFAITATWQSTQFTMGDGHTKGCAAMTQYPPHLDHPGESSPTCGYVYEVASPKGRPYVVSAQESWLVEWSSGGDRGSFVHSYSGSRTLEVGELMSLIKG